MCRRTTIFLAIAAAVAAKRHKKHDASHDHSHSHHEELTHAAASPIKHIVYLMMENRAFDHMLGWMTRNDSRIRGLSGSEYNFVNPADPNSQKVYVTDKAAYKISDPNHSVEATAFQIFGHTPTAAEEHNPALETMGGFVANYAANWNASDGPHIMDAFAPEDVPVIASLVSNFAVFDAYHASIPGPTFVNRLFAVSGTSWGYGDNDVEQTVLGWPQRSIFEDLDAANVSWSVYFEEVPTPALLADMRSDARLSRLHFLDQFYVDAAAGNLSAFTWLDPSYFDIPGELNEATDQHPDHDVTSGERLMKKVYEALRASPLWNSTALVITYDEHGGFYDAKAPLNVGVPSPDGRVCVDCHAPFNFTRMGVRVPFIVASPWVPRGTVVHEPAPGAGDGNMFEHSSLPATLRKQFALGGNPLTAREAWASTFDFVWSGLSAPRTDCPLTLPTPPAQSPSFTAAGPGARDGSKPLTALQTELALLAAAVARKIESPGASIADAPSGVAGIASALYRYLDGAGIEATEAAVGSHMRALFRAALPAARARIAAAAATTGR